MNTRWERRQRKYDKARYGMRVDGAGIRGLPSGGGKRTYIVKVPTVGWYTVTAGSEQAARRQVVKMLPRGKRKLVTQSIVELR